MQGSRTKNSSRNMIWGFLNKTITILLPFVTRTAMIYTMGMNYVGLGSLFTSILQVLSFAELGIGSAIVFSLYKPIANEDEAKVSALLNFYRTAYRYIGIIILGVGLIMMPFLDKLVKGDIPNGINLQSLFAIYLINNILGYFLFAYKQALFTASQRVDIISKIGMILQLCLSIIQISVLFYFHNYYVYAIAIPVITVLNNLIIASVSNKSYPQYKPSGKINIEDRNEIRKKIGGMLFQKLGNIILNAADTIVISAFLGLSTLGVYNGYYLIVNSLFGFLTVIQQSIIPSIGNSIANESVEKNLADLKKIHFLYMWIVMWGCCCLLCLYQPFIRLWQGSDNMLSFTMVILFVAYFFSYKMGDICWMYREAMGLWWEARFIPLTSSIVNLGLNLCLVNLIGLPGILVSTIVSVALINVPWSSKVLFSKYFKSKLEFWLYLFRTIKYFIIMVTAAGLTWLVCNFIPGDKFLTLVIKTIICLILPNCIILSISFKSKEFIAAKQLLKRLIPKFFKHTK